MDGVLVQEMAPEGPDLIVGGLQDPVFGPVVLGGIGGGEAELWGDRRLALAPLGPTGADALWRGLRGAPLLDGWRGAPSVPRAPLGELTQRVAWLLADQPLLAGSTSTPCERARTGGPWCSTRGRGGFPDGGKAETPHEGFATHAGPSPPLATPPQPVPPGARDPPRRHQRGTMQGRRDLREPPGPGTTDGSGAAAEP